MEKEFVEPAANAALKKGSETLLLKWGTLKGWKLESETSRSAIQKFAALGLSASAMMQEMTPAHKEALCELIDALDGEIQNDWSGDMMTKDEAKGYVMNYGIKATSGSRTEGPAPTPLSE